MSVRFRNAPLVELVVELRWNAPSVFVPGPGPTVVTMGGIAAPDRFLEEVAERADVAGYRNSEHLVPPGFPPTAGQVIRRFRARPGDPILLQVGLDTFSVNALPPYTSWDQFSPKVREAVQVLVASRAATGSEGAFVSATVRYIDAFDSRFTSGVTPAAFITDTLGFKPQVPGAIERRASSGALEGVSLQYAFRTEDELRVQLSVGDGQINATQAVIYDSVVGRYGAIAPEVDTIMAILDAAHLVAHEMFIDVAKNVFDIMQPVDGDQ